MNIFKKTKGRLKSTAGASYIEYSIIVALISITGITVVLAFGEELRGLYFDTGGEVQKIKLGGLENGSQVPGGYLVDGVVIPESPECWQATAEIPSIHFPHSVVYSCFTGNNGANTIEASGRNDTINSGGGDDTVIYTGGADIITGGTGFDVLDLTAFNSADVVFDINQETNVHDVLFSVNGGSTVELHYQARLPESDSNVSFNQISFKDLTIMGDDIILRAIDDQGTSGDDHIYGTILPDAAIRPRGGNDIIDTNGGSDTIIYESGNDIILAGNSSSDTLDLSKYNAADVSFEMGPMNRFDVFINTPDGVIELDYQVRSDIGVAPNIGTAVFADGSISEAEIRSRAISDQETSGNNTILGTLYSDSFSPLAGNDSVTPGDGDDSIVYTSGADVIVRGNKGSDTLDLSKYNDTDVTFSLSGAGLYDIFITTPDGSVELDYQVRKPVGHVDSNIETIIFSNLTINEADIFARAQLNP